MHRGAAKPLLADPPCNFEAVKREAGKRGARALLAQQKAFHAEHVAPVDVPWDDARNRLDAERARAEAQALAAPLSESGRLVVGVGTGEAMSLERGECDSATAGVR